MTSDSALPDLLSTGLLTSEVNDNLQVHFKSEEGQLLLILPAEAETLASATSWYDLWQQAAPQW